MEFAKVPQKCPNYSARWLTTNDAQLLLPARIVSQGALGLKLQC
jgi:hypothetical protein